ncbi:hypothetical protein KSP39_PZI022939 [Platanthera zijinensis]|uniref:Uncharacterized protein n=1 Tax=Platanthera zijinensis TaxID=2320716 RepID=A0AAP0AUY6_9ASPA
MSSQLLLLLLLLLLPACEGRHLILGFSRINKPSPPSHQHSISSKLVHILKRSRILDAASVDDQGEGGGGGGVNYEALVVINNNRHQMNHHPGFNADYAEPGTHPPSHN